MTAHPNNRSQDAILSVRPIIGMEVHVELATRTKMFTRCPSPAAQVGHGFAENELIDPVVLALPGALPVMNERAVELSVRVGLALRCSIATFSKWDRKGYFYPDLPKAYQISQYDLPLCFDGAIDLPGVDDKGFIDTSAAGPRIRIIRAHLEEDAGKLMHELPASGGGEVGRHRAIEGSIVDLNRAGTPLLEIVTAPDFARVEDIVLFAKMLRSICVFLGATHGVMQLGHMRFEPNINCELTLRDGSLVRTPITEVKNLNSFKSLRDAAEYELAQQPARWVETGKVMGPGAKVTRGWDEKRGVTFVQREKEDAQDYRYFPDPDLPPVTLSQEWIARVRESMHELPLTKVSRYVGSYGLAPKEAAALAEEPGENAWYESAIRAMVLLGAPEPRAGKAIANIVLQQGFRAAKEKGVLANELGVSSDGLAALAMLRELGEVSNRGVDELFGAMMDLPVQEVDALRELAKAKSLLIVKDDAAMAGFVAKAIEANPQAAADVRAGKQQAIGRLVGEVVKLSTAAGAPVDAKTAREELLKVLK